MSRTLFFFYLLVVYVLLQFSWWAFLLINLNDEIIQYRILLLETKNILPKDVLIEQAKYYAELKHRWMMVFGEGIVFLGLLIFGIYRIRTSFFREVALARQQKNFLLSITHEFKSPLAAIKLNLQTIQKRLLAPEQRDEVLRKALIETERIHILVENALMASRLESHNYDLYFEKINLSDFVHSTVSDFIERQDHEFNIQHTITPGIYINGDRLSLTSVMNNLLENAEKYSPPGTNIQVNLSRSNNDAVITISDEGIGIPHGEELKIFDKFYRIGNEETRKTKGTGLGLFIVQHVTHLHKGKVEVKNNKPKGSIFEIRLHAL